jgi:hypothetical protein
MIQGLVAGTLAALNSIVAPLGTGHDDVANTFRFAVQNAPPAATACMSRGQDPTVRIKLEPAGEFTVAVRMETKLCNAKQKLAIQKSSVVLPLDVFDNAFLASLVVGRPYILQAIDDPSHPEYKSRLKVTRLKESLFANLSAGKLGPGAGAAAGVASVNPTAASVANAQVANGVPVRAFLIEWVPNSATAAPEHPPLTVWMKVDPAEYSASQKRLASGDKSSAGTRKPISVTDSHPHRSAYDGRAAEASLLTFPWERFSYSMKKDEVVGLLRSWRCSSWVGASLSSVRRLTGFQISSSTSHKGSRRRERSSQFQEPYELN